MLKKSIPENEYYNYNKKPDQYGVGPLEKKYGGYPPSS
jgi:hypothetical protein